MLNPTSVESSVVCPVLIGRAHIVEALSRSLDAARSGNGQVIVLAGEAGIGKSRLVAEVKARAALSGLSTLQGNCFEPDRALPYAPWLDLLHSFCAERPPNELAREIGSAASELVKLSPELSNWLPDVAPAPEVEPEQHKRRVFQSLEQFLIRLAVVQPRLIVIEDLHWSDDTSLDFLHHLTRRIQTAPILLLLTYRNDETSPSLRHWLAQMDRRRLAAEFVLNRLQQDEVGEMLRALLNLQHPVRAEFLESIYALTEGNPFFIEEVLKSLMVTGEISTAAGQWDRKPMAELYIPRSVQDAVQQRLERLSADARQVITLAAVAGRRFDFALLQPLTLRDEHELLENIKELIGAQLVVEESAEQFAFRHALTREAVYASLLARERKQHHRAIAETMERLSADSIDAQAGDLAIHFYEAGVWDKSLDYSQRAGERAAAMFAPREAIEHFTRALQAAHQLPQPSPVRQLHRGRGQAYELLGEFERARADHEAALQEARAGQDRHTEWQVLLDLGFLWAARDYDKTGEYFRQALTLARSMADPETLGHTLNRVGNWHANADLPREASRYHQEALDIFQELNDKRGLAETYDLLGLTMNMNGDWAHSQAYYEQAIALLRELGDQRGLASALALYAERGNPFYSEYMSEQPPHPDEALGQVEESLRLAREIGWRPGEAYALVLLGSLWGARGECSRALSLVQEGLAVAGDIEHQQWMALAHLCLGGLHASWMAFDAARDHIEQALAFARDTRSVNFVRRSTMALVLVCIQQKDFARARQMLDSDSDPAAEIRTFNQQLRCYARAELALAQGNAAQALRTLDEQVAPGTDAAALAVPRWYKLRGEALMALGRLAEAETALHTARASVATKGIPLLEWQYHIALGKLYRLQRRRDLAEAQFEAAQTIIAALAATLPDEGLRRNFRERALALIPSLAPPSSLRAAKKEFSGLTARERQVAALIAQGKSNREIARTLVVGERTVETHVENILAKLGFDSRTQIAAWAVEKGLTKDGPVT